MAPTVLARFRNTSANRPVDGESRKLWVGWVLALVATVAFSGGAPISKGLITAGMNPTALLMIRLLISTLLLAGSISLTAPYRLLINRGGLLICTIAGLANGIGMLTFFWALSRIQASIASMIFSLSPLMVLGLLALRGEKFTRRHILRLGLGLGGVYLLIGPGSVAAGGVDWVGVSLVFITVMAVAVHLSLLQWFLKSYDAWTVTLYIVATMTIVSLGSWLTEGTPWRSLGWWDWLAIGVLAVGNTYLARLTMFAAVRRLGSGQMALLLPVETLLTVIWSVLFLHEWLTTWQWLGGALILLSALLAVKRLRWARWRPRWRTGLRP